MFVKLTQKLERGFLPWKQMFHENEATLNGLEILILHIDTSRARAHA